MAAANDPTPCPAPRRSISNASYIRRPQGICASSSLLPAIAEGKATVNLDYIPQVSVAKPRRPRDSRMSISWDPSKDIYDDTFAFNLNSRASSQTQLGSRRTVQQSSELPQNDRRSSLLALPAQRLQLDSKAALSNEQANNKRRRTSTNFQETESNPGGFSGVSSHTNAPDNQSILRREARRRTIYVPSDDTTIMTIHPGASLKDQRQISKKPCRSDIFLDLAEMSEAENDQPNVFDRSKRGPRMSLAAAPRRAPLNQTSRQTQAYSSIPDVPGNGPGKENVPPASSGQLSKAGKRPSTAFKLSTVLEKPVTLSSFCESVEHNTTDSSRSAVLSKETWDAAPQSSTITGTSRSRTSRAFSSQLRRDSSLVQPLIASSTNRMRTSCSSPRVRPQEKVPTRLSVPMLASQSQSQFERYPILSENISRPEMYEDDWLSYQETAISQLLNNLFEEASCSNSTAARSSDDARKRLLEIYQDPSFSLLYKRLQASLLYGAMSMPTETLNQTVRIKEDLAQRRRFLDLWMKTYDLAYLQIAAEVVIGRQVQHSPRPSNASSSGENGECKRASSKAIATYLKTFLVCNEDVTLKRTRRETGMDIGVPGVNPQESDLHAKTWRRTVLRSLMLIILLDKAHRSGKLPRRLFQKSSSYKSSAAVVQGLCKLLVPSVGDCIRVLGHLDYEVQQVQYPLQEYDYHVTNLATDLRDGVLLTRLVEILLYPPATLAVQQGDVTVTLPCGEMLTSDYDPNRLNWVLSQHLKYPCVGRAQQVHNVQLALSALRGVKGIDCNLGDTKAEDIVDGHREKTLGLMWLLVGRWGLDVLLDFRLVEKEIRRLRKHSASQDDAVEGLTENEDATLAFGEGLEKSNALLKSWAHEVARTHGVQVTNLSTSFADGRAFQAILDEYLPCGADRGRRSDSQTPDSLSDALKRLGCSQSFIGLLKSVNTVPSLQTIVPQLAFLASRLLPPAVQHHAAAAIQRAWRRSMAKTTFTRRLALARLAHDCATVVRTRERIIWAAVVLQRRWKAMLMRRPRHERPP